MNPVAEFHAALLCEDIRKEANGKIILVGVFAGDIVVATFPARLTVRLYLEGRLTSDDEQELNFIWLLDGKESARIEGRVGPPAEGDGSLVVPLPPVGLEFKEPCTLAVRRSDTGALVIEKSVVAGPVVPPF